MNDPKFPKHKSHEIIQSEIEAELISRALKEVDKNKFHKDFFSALLEGVKVVSAQKKDFRVLCAFLNIAISENKKHFMTHHAGEFLEIPLVPHNPLNIFLHLNHIRDVCGVENKAYFVNEIIKYLAPKEIIHLIGNIFHGGEKVNFDTSEKIDILNFILNIVRNLILDGAESQELLNFVTDFISVNQFSFAEMQKKDFKRFTIKLFIVAYISGNAKVTEHILPLIFWGEHPSQTQLIELFRNWIYFCILAGMHPNKTNFPPKIFKEDAVKQLREKMKRSKNIEEESDIQEKIGAIEKAYHNALAAQKYMNMETLISNWRAEVSSSKKISVRSSMQYIVNGAKAINKDSKFGIKH